MPNKLDFPTTKQLRGASSVHVAIYVPSTKDKDKPISSAQFNSRIEEVKRLLNSFGGSTSIRGIGSYNLEGKTISEKVAIVESFTNPRNYKAMDTKIKAFILRKKKQWGQDSIGYEYEEKLIFI